MPLYRVDFQGVLQSSEIFQHGHHVSSADTANGVASDAATLWLAALAVTAFSGRFSTGTVWTQVNVSELGASPSAPVVTSAQAAITDGGTSSAAQLPNQISPVISIRTATAGSRARGRMYLPPPVNNVLSNAGRLDTTPATDIIDAVEDYFDGMTTAGHSLVVVSGVGGVYTTYPAIDIRLGNVLDTQRNRRNDLAETYISRTV